MNMNDNSEIYYDNPVTVKDIGVTWCDGAALLSDGTLFEHRFYNKSLVSLIRRKIAVDRSPESDYVSSRELSLFVTGRCRRRVAGFSIYWHSNSDLIYVLTGVPYCAQIYVECGYDLPEGGVEMLPVPRVFLVRARDATSGIMQVSWSKTAGIWPKDVMTKLAKLAPNTPDARPPVPISPTIGTVGFPRVPLIGDAVLDAAYIPIIVGDRSLFTGSCSESKLKIDYDTSIFLEKAAAVYRRLLTVDRELESSVGRRREIILMCSQLSTRKRLLLVDGTAIVNFFVSQICLYGFGEDNVAQEIVGVLHRRKDKGDASFQLHNIALANAMQLGLILRRIQEHPEHLPMVENRIDVTDPMIIAAMDFFSSDVDVNISVISMAGDVLKAFSSRGSIEDAMRVLNGRVPLSGCVDRSDVIKVLKL
uniref:Tegument protein UL88 n=1 Tax=Mastomys natalensis cytomegalovirus 1 TaxID=2973541 RepID=A0A9Y1N7G9_9BETA|nr:tegument protein UL88 [Mastomys natalensis cytomegalovirus 1]